LIINGQAFYTPGKYNEVNKTTVVALFALTGCDNATPPAQHNAVQEVGVVTLQSQPLAVFSTLTGRTSASLSAEVRPQVGGIIQKRLFTEGDTVKAGQPLYQIDPSSYRAAFNEADASLKQAQSLVESDCQKARRYALLVKDNGVSQQDADDAKSTCAQDAPASAPNRRRWKARVST
jgi:membrane fusion protein (multidrug efflux system)